MLSVLICSSSGSEFSPSSSFSPSNASPSLLTETVVESKVIFSEAGSLALLQPRSTSYSEPFQETLPTDRSSLLKLVSGPEASSSLPEIPTEVMLPSFGPHVTVNC